MTDHTPKAIRPKPDPELPDPDRVLAAMDALKGTTTTLRYVGPPKVFRVGHAGDHPGEALYPKDDVGHDGLYAFDAPTAEELLRRYPACFQEAR